MQPLFDQIRDILCPLTPEEEQKIYEGVPPQLTGRTIMCRYYYWFKGASENRPGGPWWFRDFLCRADLDVFQQDVAGFLHAHTVEPLEGCPFHDPMDIKPPGEYEILG